MRNFFVVKIIALIVWINIFYIEKIVAQTNSIKNESILAPNAKLILVDSSFSFTEGASTDKEGNVYFTDQPNDNIWNYDVNGKLSLFMHSAKRSNGTYFDSKGNLISCADENDELISISPSKKITALIKNYKAHTFNGPNDLWIDAHGSMYITDPYFQRDYWQRTHPDSVLGGEYVYYFNSNKKQLTIADSTTKKPNGITVHLMGNICMWQIWVFGKLIVMILIKMEHFQIKHCLQMKHLME